MPAEFLAFDESPPTIGGDFERDAMRRLREKLSHDFLVVGNVSFPTLSSFFYEYDVILTTVDLCDVLEAKAFIGEIIVLENCIRCIDGFCTDRVFSILENKAKVLSSRIAASPFAHGADVRVNSRVIVPDGCKIIIRHDPHRTNRKVMRLSDAIEYYKSINKGRNASDASLLAMRNGWKYYRNEWTSPGERTQKTLGRFYIKPFAEFGIRTLLVSSAIFRRARPSCKSATGLMAQALMKSGRRCRRSPWKIS